MQSHLSRPQKTLIIGPIWPEPQSSAAGTRSMSLIRIFQQAGFEVHFAAPSKKAAGESQESLEQHPENRLRAFGVAAGGAGVKTQSIELNDSSFDAWVAELAPDIVVFERFMMEEQFGWRVQQACPGAMRVLETCDLQFLRRARQCEVKNLNPRTAELLFGRGSLAVAFAHKLVNEDAFREIAAIYRSDLALVISDAELAILTDEQGLFRMPRSQVKLFSFCYERPACLKSNAQAPGDNSAHTERKGFCSIGNFRHEPNADGVLWLKREIWPLIRKRLPDAEVHLYGAYPSREFMQLDSPSTGFRVHGPAADQYASLAKHRVNLAALRFGAGLKGKISDGWWAGTPCVATSIGAEGMTLLPETSEDVAAPSFGGVIADSPEDFANAAVELYEKSGLWARARDTGLRIVAEKFNHDKNAQTLLRNLETVRANLAAHRAANFMGQMLRHHSHRSTEYFSRWIELKNKNAR